MTENKKRRKLSVEILAIVGLCFAFSAILYFFITCFGGAIIDGYCFYNDVALDEFEQYRLDTLLFTVAFAISAVFFIILFLILFSDRLSYIRKLTNGVHALRSGSYGTQVELIGNNDLTELAEAINYLSDSELRLKTKEIRLNEEKAELIRTLSHDIRTPLTSVISYTELLAAKNGASPEELREYLDLVTRKTSQIKELTDILLDGGRRELEPFEDASLLFLQLASEFENELEDGFDAELDLSTLSKFSGSFDVREMRRIFDNLISNVQKYALPSRPVRLSVSNTDAGIIIRQSNTVNENAKASEGFKVGLNSIRRIAHNYGGGIDVVNTGERFEISVTLSDF